MKTNTYYFGLIDRLFVLLAIASSGIVMWIYQPWGFWYAVVAGIVVFLAIFFAPFVHWNWSITLLLALPVLGAPLIYINAPLPIYLSLYMTVALSVGLLTAAAIWGAPSAPNSHLNAGMSMALAVILSIFAHAVFHTTPALAWIIWTTSIIAWPIAGAIYRQQQIQDARRIS